MIDIYKTLLPVFFSDAFIAKINASCELSLTEHAIINIADKTSRFTSV
jgi:hypothetical protein